MLELLLIPIALWCLLVSAGVLHLLLRPPDIPSDEVDVLREFVERLRKLTVVARKRGK